MQKLLKTSLKVLVGIFLAILLYIIIVLVHGTLTDYQPEAVIPLEATQSSTVTTISDSILSLVIWNLGYGGLGEESDFFYDSGNQIFSDGKMIRAPKAAVYKNIDGELDLLKKLDADIYLLQEVDFLSKRSYYREQYKEITEAFPDYASFFAPNYKVNRVPIPIAEPWQAYGATYSGLGSFLRYQPEESTRYQLPGNFSWPTRIFSLDRCVAFHRLPVSGGKELVLLNIHNSAYDANGGLKEKQMDFLKGMMLEEAQKGNYVIAGGDWNMCPPGFPFDKFMPGKTDGYNQIPITDDYFPEGWQWVYDEKIPTNRKTNKPYKAGMSFVTIIDFYLVSPGMEVLTVEGIDQQFQFSDHQPVKLEVKLK